ncbi:oligosaccharide flippase family protein, partial [Candidatus Woesearchaeota archaeon]|nr:oligosaccharide flippase family protein [Candidatus Woesearchaeota archaeon]
MSNKVLGEVAKGAGIIFLGTLFAYLFKFIFRILVSRFFGPENFGLFSIGDMLLNIGLLLSLLGLSSGIVKFISHYFALGHTEKAKGAFFGSLKISIILSIIISGLFIIFAKEIAILIFNNSDLVNILIVFSLTIP